jgi:hypothetical protein
MDVKIVFLNDEVEKKVYIVLMLESATMNTMLANDCQDLLFIYINNILVGGTPLLYSWQYGG